MKINNIYCSSCSAAFELENNLCYLSEQEYSVYLNGQKTDLLVKSNVFSLFNLSPDTQYKVHTSLSDTPVIFSTKKESCCINVLDFGAVGDGIKDDTKPIQMAIMSCPEYGRVLIPKGIYFVSPITLKSHITIDMQKGAKLIGSTNEDDYFVLPGEVVDCDDGSKVECVSWEGCPVPSHQSLLSAYHMEDIHIVGKGIVDGNAQNSTWWIDVKNRPIARPKLLYTNKCNGLYIHGVNFMNSPCWHLHPYNTKNIGIYDISVTAPKNSPNTDGFDPECCDTVEVIGAHFSVGDDAIAIKSGKMYDGKIKNISATNHTIRNCLMEFAHGAVVLGSEMSGGIKDLTVSKCLFRDTDRGLRIKTRRGRGKDAIVDGVTFENIKMDGVLTPLVVNMFYFCDPDGKSDYVQNKQPLPVDERTPYLGKFCFKNMECSNCSTAAGFFYGLPEQPIEQIEIENVDISFDDNCKKSYPAMMLGIDKYSKMGLYFNNVKKVKINKVSLSEVEGEDYITNNVGVFTEK